jgi:hypothetical protein
MLSERRDGSRRTRPIRRPEIVDRVVRRPRRQRRDERPPGAGSDLLPVGVGGHDRRLPENGTQRLGLVTRVPARARCRMEVCRATPTDR